MIDALKFVQGAVAEKDFVPELTHFHIKNGRITGFNGRMALSSPIDLSIVAYPEAKPFVKAIAGCGSAVEIGVTDGGKLRVSSGPMRVYIRCLDTLHFEATPQGEVYNLPETFLEDLEVAYRFVGADASRAWSMSVASHHGCFYATNNVVAIQTYHGTALPDMTIPHFAVREVLRNKAKPVSLQTDGHSLTFFFSDGRWLRTQLIEDMFPFELMESAFARAVPIDRKLPDELFEALDAIKPFAISRVWLNEDKVRTSDDQSGAEYTLKEPVPPGCFNLDCLRLLKGMEQIGWGNHEIPSEFRGGRSRGMILGMRP